jgi:methyl-accepting chemotaxis protein
MKRIKNLSDHVKLFITIITIYVIAVVFGAIGFYTLQLAMKSRLGQLIIGVAFVILTFLAILFAKNAAWKIGKVLNKLKEKNNWFKEIIDAMPFPVHVTDINMNWVFMNKAYEKTLIDQGIITDRESAYGMHCSNEGADICSTDGCGIYQLSQGNTESYFEWGGKSCKQDTAYLKNELGENVGYVEVVTDLTSIIKVSDYNKSEIKRVVEDLNKLALGDLDLDFNIMEADSYTEEAHSQFATINDSLGKVKNALELMIGDTDMLVDAAVEGNLSVRADEERHQGDYRKVIEGVNKILDAIKEPLDVASEFISNLAVGQHQERMENNYKGYYATLIDNLNNVRHALKYLVSETSKLTEAGLNGDLTVRGEVGKLQGDYLQIVDGFNNTLDAIVAPLDEANTILGRMAVNDYAEKMSDGHMGMLKTFAESINDVHNRLLSLENLFVQVAKGDTSLLEEFKEIGQRSENDKIVPAAVAMMQAIQDLIDESKTLAKAAVEGNLSTRADTGKFEGGYETVIDGMNKTLEAVEQPFQEISEVLTDMAKGDFTVTMQGDYKGSYAQIKNAMNSSITSISEVLSEISKTSEEVAAGSSQVSDGSQALSQGATEQASSIEELTSSITEIAAQTKQNAINAGQASQFSNSAKEDAANGNGQMQEMLRSMSEINESSSNISKIIKVIEDIAFQTNILALNAAVEAARAGQYGKGFAVVAEEVRNLAGKSAEAAKNTTTLIEGSIKKVEEGTKIANNTAEALIKIVEGVDKAANLVGEISTASNEQATGISQIDKGIEQVSQVVQTNSATAEESAAASEELSGQAEALKSLVGKFKLMKNVGASTPEKSNFEALQTATSKAQAAASKPQINLSNAGFGKY